MADLPIACSLTPDALAARRDGLLKEVIRRAKRHEDIADGHLFQFAADGDVLDVIARAVEVERQCCPFLRFHITVESDGGPILLELTGPAGTREFLSAILDQ